MLLPTLVPNLVYGEFYLLIDQPPVRGPRKKYVYVLSYYNSTEFGAIFLRGGRKTRSYSDVEIANAS